MHVSTSVDRRLIFEMAEQKRDLGALPRKPFLARALSGEGAGDNNVRTVTIFRGKEYFVRKRVFMPKYVHEFQDFVLALQDALQCQYPIMKV